MQPFDGRRSTMVVMINLKQDFFLLVFIMVCNPMSAQQDSALADTRYHGLQWMTTTRVDSVYLLTELRDGTKITTYNAKTVSIWDLTEDLRKAPDFDRLCVFSDEDNYWNNFNAQYDEIAADVHWSVEKTYDYFNSFHRWPGMDGQHGEIRSVLHLGQNWDEAFHLPPPFDMLGFGDGGPVGPNATLDVVAHEYTHGVIHHAAGLLYIGEAAVLDEGIADIFGTVVKLESQLEFLEDHWTLAEQQGGYRSISAPKDFGQPDTYLGEYWYRGDDQDIFAHHNNGVINYWFYLLVDGGVGENDFGYRYNVLPIGLDESAEIVFETLLNELAILSDIHDFARGTLAVAERIGGDNYKIESIEEAWRAVGVLEELTSITDEVGPPFSIHRLANEIKVEFTQTVVGPVTLQLFDIMGKPISTATSPYDSEMLLQLDAIPPGIYFLMIQVKGESYSTKILINQ